MNVKQSVQIGFEAMNNALKQRDLGKLAAKAGDSTINDSLVAFGEDETVDINDRSEFEVQEAKWEAFKIERRINDVDTYLAEVRALTKNISPASDANALYWLSHALRRRILKLVLVDEYVEDNGYNGTDPLSLALEDAIDAIAAINGLIRTCCTYCTHWPNFLPSYAPYVLWYQGKDNTPHQTEYDNIDDALAALRARTHY